MDNTLLHYAYDMAAVGGFLVAGCSLAVRILPPPDELAADLGRTTSTGWYRALFNQLRRIALNAPYQPRNGGHVMTGADFTDKQGQGKP